MTNKVAVHSVVQCASNITRIPVEEFYLDNRRRYVAFARFAVFAVCSEQGHGMNEIARRMNGRDHTSIIHGVRRAEEFERTKAPFRLLMAALREGVARIGNAPRPRLVPAPRQIVEKMTRPAPAPHNKTGEELQAERNMIYGSRNLAIAVMSAGGYR